MEQDQGWRSKVTRQDRAIYDEAWIEDFLRRAGMGTLATVSDGQPFLATLLFVYVESQRVIYIHKARRGRVWKNITAVPGGVPVCFTASEMGRLLPADTAMGFSVEYQSVVVFGTAALVEDPAEAERALQLILDKYFAHLQPGRDYRPITPGERDSTAVFRITVEEWSGKRKAAAEDFPGAFRFGADVP